jgi:hypothetical protein
MGIQGDSILDLCENSAGWRLAFDSARVQMIQVDFRLGLLIADESGTAQIHIESPFKFQLPDGEWVRIVPEKAETISPILSLANRFVFGVLAGNDGALSIKFDGGYEMQVPPGEQYESWQLAYGRKLLVSGPEGKMDYFQQPGRLD